MDTVKNKTSKLLSLFLITFALFNVLFFTHVAITDWWYDRINIYSKCADDSADTSDLYELQNCDINSLSRVDDVILGIFALSAIASAVLGSLLLIRLMARIGKRLKRHQ